MNSVAPKQYFTVEDANKRLPLVKSIVGDIVELFAAVSDRRLRLDRLKSEQKRSEADDVYTEELENSEEALNKDISRLQGYVEELESLGIELKDPQKGLVDFRTRIQGRDAYLCWQPGESEVGYWHELDAGFQGRQMLLEGMLDGEGLDGDNAENA